MNSVHKKVVLDTKESDFVLQIGVYSVVNCFFRGKFISPDLKTTFLHIKNSFPDLRTTFSPENFIFLLREELFAKLTVHPKPCKLLFAMQIPIPDQF